MDAASVANQFIEAFNKADWERFSALCSPDMIYEEKGSNRTAKGLDAVLEVGKGWREAFPDIRGTIYGSANCGTTAVLEIRWTGTNDGPLETAAGKLPATGKSVEFDDAQIYNVEGGKVTAMRNYGDFLTMLTQLGVLPG
jgi:steroid delta-isomerase-like uncharacterized protein